MIIIERNLDLTKVERRVTTLSDLMSDVGGFFGLLVMFGRVFSRISVVISLSVIIIEPWNNHHKLKI